MFLLLPCMISFSSTNPWSYKGVEARLLFLLLISPSPSLLSSLGPNHALICTLPFLSCYLQTLKDEYVEIQSFCLEYSRVKEAAALYRLVKTLEGGGAPTYQ